MSAQTSAVPREDARRRPLVQYVISERAGPAGNLFRVELSNAGTKPSHWLIDPPQVLALEATLEAARTIVPAGYKRLARRKDDPINLVEVWV